ncbi:MAG: class I SAM-dependent methyltransferase [Gemmatimonadaceae bacterium]|nr:class I SAM-dependent methyltransferase [Gemmatimonadaceae bacterium]
MYSRYYEEHKADRNDLLGNPEVTFQTFAFDRANIRALRRMDLERESARILDVGCGTGAGLIQFLRLGFTQQQMSGVDISTERIEQARRALPLADLRCESGDAMSYGAGDFDIVFESTMFVLIPSDDMASRIAREMVRVTKPGGYLMLVDWRYSKPGSDVYKAMSKRRIAKLFDVGGATSVVAREKGALVPPLGRALSRYAPSLYFAVQALIPPAVGQMTTVLRKS